MSVTSTSASAQRNNSHNQTFSRPGTPLPTGDLIFFIYPRHDSNTQSDASFESIPGDELVNPRRLVDQKVGQLMIRFMSLPTLMKI